MIVSARRSLFFATGLLVLLALTWGCVGDRAVLPVALRGVLDLSSHDFSRGDPVRLDGEWEFYWDRLLAPDDFAPGPPPPVPTGYLAFPGSWQGYPGENGPLPGDGKATFRLRLLPGPGLRKLTLQVFDIQAACRLWVDGELTAESGVVGASAATERPNPSLILAKLRTDGHPLDLVLQVSNYHLLQGGVPSALMLARPGPLERAYQRTLGTGLFFAGSLLVMGLYHLALYHLRKKDVSARYFGWYCLLWMGNILTCNVTDWAITVYVPGIPFLPLDKVSLGLYALSVPVGYRFFRTMYPREFSLWVQHLCDVAAVAFFAVIVFFPTQVLYAALPYSYMSSIAFIGYCFARLPVCLRRGRDGALWLLCGFLLLGLAAINDMLCSIGLIRSVYLIQVGMFAFILCQAVALAQRFSHAFSAVEDLSVALERNNASLREEMTERGRLEREVVSISEEERRRISHELHDGLCQKLTAARLRFAVLARTLAGSGDAAELRLLAELLDASANDAYGLSRGLWPAEHGPGATGPSLEELTRNVSAASGIAVSLRQDRRCPVCDNPQATTVFRILQEALANAVKHARAGRIVVTLACADSPGLTLTVADDGIGREAAAANATSGGGLGFRIMAHRARIIGASLSVADGPEGGTTVTCKASCPKCPHAAATPAGDGHDRR